MKPNTSARGSRSPHEEGVSAPTGAHRGRVLIVEPDPLTQWSLKTFLGRWFSVESADSIAGAEQVLETRPVEVLVVSDELPSAPLALLERQAHRLNDHVAIVRTVTDPGHLRQLGPCLGCLEKPFELAQLARLLGIPGNELPHDA